METRYQPREIDKRACELWEKLNLFSADSPNDGGNDGDPYCIILPPPNVTGTLHMGHAFQTTIMDCLCRYRRLRKNRVLWQPGTDHAGIATQIVVAKQLEKENLTPAGIGREAFIEKVWEWKKQSGGTITTQLRRLGASLSWERERFTMDDDLSVAVREAFIRLYNDGLIYRGKRLINWDPVMKTAVSDLEVVAEEEQGHLWELRYPVDDTGNSDDCLVVATTRPETLFGDTAVAVHPEDERYRAFIGKTVALPLTERHIPVIADEHVDMEFGTGCVKVTPAHDFNDYQIGQRHDLPLLEIFNDDATLNENVPKPYRGLDRYDARKQVVADLRERELLENIKDHKHTVPRGERSGQVVEPRLSDQWFIHAEPLAKEAIKAVKDGRVEFIPENWKTTYFEWLENIQDWCISRQIWWGHQIPAWYDDAGNIYVGHDEDAVRKQHKLDDATVLRRDEDVLDTWFSSSLWPFTTMGWPKETDELKTFYPSNVLVTGFDIIFFWVARMIMMGLHLTGDVPFKQVYVHGLVRDAYGQKMSKSKGNTLDPLDLIDGIELDKLVEKRLTGVMQDKLLKRIEKDTRKEFPDGIKAFGTDAVRFTFMSLASTGRDVRFDLGRLEGYRNFCNKLWNAARYVISLCDEGTPVVASSKTKSTPLTAWMRGKLNALIEETSSCYNDYRFDWLSQSIYSFVWHDYCDWLLEFSKVVEREGSDEERVAMRVCLLETLNDILVILHPISPFITEEIWVQIKHLQQDPENAPESILQCNYPAVITQTAEEKAASDEIERVRLTVGALRRTATELGIAHRKGLPLCVQHWDDGDKAWYARNAHLISALGNVAGPQWLAPDAPVHHSALAIVDKIHYFIPVKDLVDLDKERERLKKESDKTAKQLGGLQKQIAHPDFLDKAPMNIRIEKEWQVKDLESRLNELKRALDFI